MIQNPKSYASPKDEQQKGLRPFIKFDRKEDNITFWNLTGYYLVNGKWVHQTKEYNGDTIDAVLAQAEAEGLMSHF